MKVLKYRYFSKMNKANMKLMRGKNLFSRKSGVFYVFPANHLSLKCEKKPVKSLYNNGF